MIAKDTQTFSLYLLECADGSIYTGITNNLEERLKKHKEGSGAKYTRAKKAVKILYTEEYLNRSAASKREIEIKSWTRQKKLALIQQKVKLLPQQ